MVPAPRSRSATPTPIATSSASSATETGASVIRRYDMMQDWVRTGRITQRDMISDDNLHMRDKGYALLARDRRRRGSSDTGSAPAQGVNGLGSLSRRHRTAQGRPAF